MLAHKMDAKFAKSWCLELVTLDLHHSLGFDQEFWFWTQIGPAQWLNWGITFYLIWGCCITTLEATNQLSPGNRFGTWYQFQTSNTTATNAPLNHCAGSIWVQNQSFFCQNQDYGEYLRSLTPKTKIWCNNPVSRRFGKYTPFFFLLK